MTRLPPDRREVNPSREASGRRTRPSFGPKMGISVPISIGLPVLVVSAFLFITAISTGSSFFLVLGTIGLIVGIALFASGKRL